MFDAFFNITVLEKRFELQLGINTTDSGTVVYFDQSSDAAPPNPSRNQSKSPQNAGISFKLIGKKGKKKKGKKLALSV